MYVSTPSPTALYHEPASTNLQDSMPCSRTLWELNLGNRYSQSVEQLAVAFMLTAERHSSFSFFQKTGCTPRIGRFLCGIFNLQFFVLFNLLQTAGHFWCDAPYFTENKYFFVLSIKWKKENYWWFNVNRIPVCIKTWSTLCLHSTCFSGRLKGMQPLLQHTGLWGCFNIRNHVAGSSELLSSSRINPAVSTVITAGQYSTQQHSGISSSQ